MKVKSFVYKNLIIVEFDKFKDMQLSSFRYMFYNDLQDTTHLKILLKTDQTGGFYGEASEFNKKTKIFNKTRKELALQKYIRKICKGKHSKYNIIVLPKSGRNKTLYHELCHHFYNKYPTFRNKARDIVMDFYKLDVIKAKIANYCDYGLRELTEETAAYFCYEQNLNAPYQKQNSTRIKKLRRLFNQYCLQFFDGNKIRNLYP